jgi:hypothetical protein
MCNGHGKCYYEQFEVDQIGKYLCTCDSNYMGSRCGWRLFENAKLRETSFTTMLELSSIPLTSKNYFKIIQIMRNYAAISEGVSRDFISLAISKAEEIIAGCYWDLGAG